MGGRAVAAAAVAALLATAATAGAGTARKHVVTSGDSIEVGGTHVVCSVGPTGGQKGIFCYYESQGHPVPGTWWIGLAGNKEATLGKVKANGGTSVVFRRKPSVRGAAARTVRAGVGDSIVIAGTALSCAVARTKTAGTYIACSPDTRGTIYGVGMADRYAYMSRYGSGGWKNVRVVRQP
jgi:hypothetical protein